MDNISKYNENVILHYFFLFVRGASDLEMQVVD
jgi:hypothetical protein